MYEELTKTQLQVLEYIKNCVSDHGYPPSVREIGKNVGLSSSSSVHYQLNQLERKGYIKRDPSKPRAIEIGDYNPFITQSEMVDIPIVGKVAAGSPIYASQNIEEYFSLPASFIGNNECFMLVIQGSSMINAGILDGDLVIVKQQNTAKDRDIVVALIEDEATVKTYYKETNCIRLQPENPMMEPIYSTNVTILGKVIGVIRRY